MKTNDNLSSIISIIDDIELREDEMLVLCGGISAPKKRSGRDCNCSCETGGSHGGGGRRCNCGCSGTISQQ